MTRMKRRVRVDAVVDVEVTEGPEDQGNAYAAVALELMKAAGMRLAGSTRPYTAMAWPVTEFTAESGPAHNCAEIRQPLPDLYWAPYQEFGTPDPDAETCEPPVHPFKVGATAYRGDDIIVYWMPPQGRTPADAGSDAEMDAWASGLDAEGMAGAALDLAEHMAAVVNDAHVWERVMALRRRREETR